MAALIQSPLSPAITSLSITSLKSRRLNNTFLGATYIKTFSPSKSHPSLSFSISRLNISQIKSEPPKHSCQLLAVCGLVDGNSEGYPGVESSDLEAGVSIDIKLPRRSLLVKFTCDKCGKRTDRLVNRLAYEGWLVYVQCAGCEKYHKLADNLGLVVEHDLRNAKLNTDQA